jgi:ferrochelatase
LAQTRFDALLVVSFGGPERPEDVIPFLENVLRGKPVPRERMLEVAEHYYHFGGKSPINDQNKELIRAVQANFTANGIELPVYWGNRNWHPLIGETLGKMEADGVRRAAVFLTSAYGSFSGCRQYREDIGKALEANGIEEMILEKLPHFCLSEAYTEVIAERVRAAYERVSDAAPLVFTAHSIPIAMAETSPYVQQLEESCKKVAAAIGRSDWALVYQSRSGSPALAWLEPDVLAHLRKLHHEGAKDVVVCPIGFCSDHMEVLYDLDTEAAALCGELGMKMARAATAGSHPVFVDLIRQQLLAGLTTPITARCFADCCPAPQRARAAG